MPPTLVNTAFGALVGAALLGAAFDRRSVTAVAGAAALPDADAVASLVLRGATNAVLHNVWLPALAAGLLYWDTRLREGSLLRRRYGWWGVRVAWVALASWVVAGVGPDLFSFEAVNLLYPVHDRFYSVVGKLVLSTEDGVVQTYLESGTLRTAGTTADYHVESWVNPTPGTANPPDAERRIRFVESGWQAVVVAAAAATVAARSRRGR